MNNQKILDNAPEGATHYSQGIHYLALNSSNSWMRYDPNGFANAKWFAANDYKLSYSNKNFRSLADIKRIAELENPWISVEDRLPDELQDVLSFDDFNGIGHTIYRAKSFKKANVVWEQTNVTHWMPLPEPPKEQE